GGFLMAANEELKKELKPVKEEVKQDSTEVKSNIESLLTDETDSLDTPDLGPIIDKMVAFGGGQVLGYYSVKDTAEINSYFRKQNIRNLLPTELRYVKFLWSKPATLNISEKQVVMPTKDLKSEKVEVVELYAIKGNRDGKPALSGSAVV